MNSYTMECITFYCEVILCATAVIGIVTYFYTAKKNRALVAMDLVKRYMEVVIPIMGFIISCIDDNEYFDHSISMKLAERKRLYFCDDEMNDLFLTADIPIYNEKFKDVSINKVISVYFANRFQLSLASDLFDTLITDVNHFKNDTEEKRQEIANEFFIKLLSKVKNEIEYFAMGFLSLGDIKLVYASIHQTYLRYCNILYLNICQHNKSRHEKYYTNMVKLYNKWNTKTQKSKKIASRKSTRVQRWLIKQK